VLPLLFLVLTTASHAQFKASIQGTITDPTGAVVVGAKVTVTNQQTSRSVETASGGTGFYRVPGLPPGLYRVTAEASGFKGFVTTDLTVNAEEPAGLDITLQPGAAAESITVTAEAPGPQTENANVTKAITTEEIRALPQAGRDPYELLRLAPGVFGDASRTGTGNSLNLPNQEGPGGSNSQIFQTENQVQIVANGQRVSANNFQVDGVSVNSLGQGGAAVITPNQESVKEVRVISNSYDASDGRNSGAQVKVISQYGVNAFHGSGVIKFNDKGLNAFNKFYGPRVITDGANIILPAPRDCDGEMLIVTLCPERVNRKFRQFAGSLGGPIVKENLFFFFSYEGVRERTSELRRGVLIETAEFRQHVIANNPGSLAAQLFSTPGIEPRDPDITTQVDCCSLNPAVALGSFYAPGPASAGLGPDGMPDWARADLRVPNSVSGGQFNARVDFNVGKNQFFVSGYRSQRDQFAGNNRPIEAIRTEPRNSTLTVSWNRVFSATLFNEARANATRFQFDEIQSSTETNFGIPRFRDLFDFDILGFGCCYSLGPPRASTTPGRLAQNTYELRDTVNKIWHSHAFKFGGEIRREQDNNNLQGGARPEYQFRGLLNLANDACCFFEGRDVDPNTGGVPLGARHFRTGDLAFFVQDDWKLRPNLTLNLGLRWEYFSRPGETNNLISNYIFGPNGLVDGSVQIVDELFEPDRNNFAPRIGFAWSPGGSQNNLVFRGGFGLNYNRTFGSVFSNIRQNTPFFASVGICCDFGGGAITTFSYGFGSSNSPFSYAPNPNLGFGVAPDGALCGNLACGFTVPVDLFGAPPQVPTPYVYSYSFEMQYEPLRNLLLTAGYQGSNSRKLVRTVDLNRLIPGDTFGDNNRDRVQNFSADGVPCGAANPACPAPRPTGNPRFNRIFFPLPDVNANYNALIARGRYGFAHGLQVEGTYTWSKTIDSASFEIGGQPLDPSAQRLDRGRADFDVRHNFVLSGIWELPLFRARKDALGKALGGWQISGIVSWHTGFPFTPILFGPDSNDPNGDGFRPDRPPTYTGGCIVAPTEQQFIDGFCPSTNTRPNDAPDPNFGTLHDCSNFNTCFTTLPRGPGGIGRNSFRGPGYSAIDLTINKRFGLPHMPFFGEGANLEVRANFFNAFNMLNLAPFGRFNHTDIGNRFDFGRSPNGLSGRVIEFQARFSF